MEKIIWWILRKVSKEISLVNFERVTLLKRKNSQNINNSFEQSLNHLVSESKLFLFENLNQLSMSSLSLSCVGYSLDSSTVKILYNEQPANNA